MCAPFYECCISLCLIKYEEWKARRQRIIYIIYVEDANMISRISTLVMCMPPVMLVPVKIDITHAHCCCSQKSFHCIFDSVSLGYTSLAIVLAMMRDTHARLHSSTCGDHRYCNVT